MTAPNVFSGADGYRLTLLAHAFREAIGESLTCYAQTSRSAYEELQRKGPCQQLMLSASWLRGSSGLDMNISGQSPFIAEAK